MPESSKGKPAEDAIAVFKRRVQGKHSRQDAKDIKKEALQVGHGLALLQQLVDQVAKKLEHSSPTRRVNLAIREAEGILDALVTGNDHPIFDHVTALRSDVFRPNKAGANITVRRQRACVAAFILAYQEAAKLETRIEAVRAIAKCCRLNSVSLGESENDEVVAQMIRQWVPRSGPTEVKKYQDQIMDRAAAIAPQDLDVPLALRVYLAGRDLVWELWSVPV
jgi:hypothetical protein